MIKSLLILLLASPLPLLAAQQTEPGDLEPAVMEKPRRQRTDLAEPENGNIAKTLVTAVRHRAAPLESRC